MDEKTAELRDIFTSVTDGEETVTESQEDTRGSLERDERTVEQRLADVVADMRERYAFEHDLSDEQLIEVAKGFYDDEDDDAIAARLDVDPDRVFEARTSLHLIDEDDADEVEVAAVDEREADADALATEYDVDVETIRRARRVAAAREESLAANHRYRDEFDGLLADAELSGRLASTVREDGLEDATEGMETDVSF